MGIYSEWKSGALLGVDGFRRSLFSDAAFVRKAKHYFEPFFPGHIIDTTHYAGFSVTAITAGTLVMADEAGGRLNLTGGGNNGEGIQMQSDGEIACPLAGRKIWFEAEIKVADADDIDWFLGLASTDTNIFSTDPIDIVAFRGDDGDANIDFQVRKAGTGAQADTGTDLVNATAIRLGFLVNGVTSVTPYINGTAKTAVTTNIPIVEMALTWGMLNGATTANNTLGLGWVDCTQLA